MIYIFYFVNFFNLLVAIYPNKNLFYSIQL